MKSRYKNHLKFVMFCVIFKIQMSRNFFLKVNSIFRLFIKDYFANLLLTFQMYYCAKYAKRTSHKKLLITFEACGCLSK